MEKFEGRARYVISHTTYPILVLAFYYCRLFDIPPSLFILILQYFQDNTVNRYKERFVRLFKRDVLVEYWAEEHSEIVPKGCMVWYTFQPKIRSKKKLDQFVTRAYNNAIRDNAKEDELQELLALKNYVKIHKPGLVIWHLLWTINGTHTFSLEIDNTEYMVTSRI